MRVMNWSWIVAVAITLLAGCTNAPPSTQTDDPVPKSSSSDTSAPPPDQLANVTPVRPMAFDLTGCTEQSTVFTWPSDSAPGTTPAGWEPETTYWSETHMTFLACERFAWGPFERTLVFAFEDHSSMRMPPSCEGHDSAVADGILDNLWVTDPEVAAYLVSNYELPASTAAISYSDSSAPAPTRTWSLTPTGATESEITFIQPTGEVKASSFGLRLIWSTSNVLGFLNLASSYSYHDPGATVANGHMEAPSTFASGGQTQWDGLAGWTNNQTTAGKVLMWKDTLCAEPL